MSSCQCVITPDQSETYVFDLLYAAGLITYNVSHELSLIVQAKT